MGDVVRLPKDMSEAIPPPPQGLCSEHFKTIVAFSGPHPQMSPGKSVVRRQLTAYPSGARGFLLQSMYTNILRSFASD